MLNWRKEQVNIRSEFEAMFALKLRYKTVFFDFNNFASHSPFSSLNKDICSQYLIALL